MTSIIKNKIIEKLEKDKRLSTTAIAHYLRLDYYYTLRYLEELVKEKKIKKEEETTATYWRIKDSSHKTDCANIVAIATL